MANELKIKVATVKEVKSKTSGQKFTVYQCVDNKGNLMDLKFRRDAQNVPKERCYIFVDADKCNVSRRSEYPVLWVETVNRIEPIVSARGNAAEYFGTGDESEGKADANDKDIPF